MLDENLFKKLQGIEKLYEEISEKMVDPDILNNPKRYTDLAKEKNDIELIIEIFRAIKKVVSEISDNKELLEEDDEELRGLAEEELPELENTFEELNKKLEILLLPKDPNDGKNILLEIRAGTGGDEAALFASDLFRMYTRFAELKKWKVEIMSSNPIGIGGLKEIIGMITGKDVYSFLKYESGVHRVQRIPSTESQGRIHTSAVTVAVLPEAEDVEIAIEEKDLQIDVYRSSGPGGQSVNTTDSAVRITHLPTNLVVICQDEKSQHKNKAKALKVLKARLLDIKQAEQDAERTKERRSQVGSGDRSQRIRTYNFPQGRVTDHRIGLTLHKLEEILNGGLESVIVALRTYFQAEALGKK